METLLEHALSELTWLVASDSTNPPRRPDALVERLAASLRVLDLEVSLTDHGEGCVSVFASRGEPRVLFNAHVDTVPVAPGWTRDPFELVVEGDRAFGLGACDVKGGAAAMIAAAAATREPCALLFTTDEEAGKSTCIRELIRAKGHEGYRFAVVAEPTGAEAVLAHRGIGSGKMTFTGRAGHASVAGSQSAIHDMARWTVAALDEAERMADSGETELRGLRLNVGRVEGGEKPNVVAGRAEARFGVRPPPELDPAEALARLAALAPGATLDVSFRGPPLPKTTELGRRARELASFCDLPIGASVDFWTEASLFSEADLPAMVLGPGRIAQAHGADEFVMLDEIARVAEHYVRILRRSAGAEGRA